MPSIKTTCRCRSALLACCCELCVDRNIDASKHWSLVTPKGFLAGILSVASVKPHWTSVYPVFQCFCCNSWHTSMMASTTQVDTLHFVGLPHLEGSTRHGSRRRFAPSAIG